MAYAILTSGETGANSLIDINANFALAAPVSSPTFTGTPNLPTGTIAVTQSPGNNTTAVATTAFVTAQSTAITIETTVGTTHSLVTTAGQKVMVWVTGVLQCVSAGSSTRTVSVKYNGVTKNSAIIYNENVTSYRPFALMYTETPGAATQNITVTTSSDTLSDVVIMLQKIG
jgi:hypothetical protein